MTMIQDVIPKKTENYPEKVLQFGEGNFLRAFVDWMIDNANRSGIYRGSIIVCQPIDQGLKEIINRQNGIYTLAMRGSEKGKPIENIEVITSVSRCINPYENYDELLKIAESSALEVIISNTTEAGIAYHAGDKLNDRPPVSFPAKVTAFLYHRFQTFQGATNRGLLFLPVELIDNNGAELKRLILKYASEWNLGKAFTDWIEHANKFTNTLVDRIVTGYPKEEAGSFESKLGYKDYLIDTCEPFNLWVIEGKQEWAEILPVHRTTANVIWTDNVKPYKKRKVRILNGAHTSTVLAAYLAGYETVLDFMNDSVFRAFMNQAIYQEIIPTLDLRKEDLENFAAAVNDRFSNPYIKHKLLDIALNSCSKFSTRCLPSILDYYNAKDSLPKCLTFSLAAFMKFYQGELKDNNYIGKRMDGSTYIIRDNIETLFFFAKAWKAEKIEDTVKIILGNTSFWNGKNLNDITDLSNTIICHLKKMEVRSVREIIQEIIK